MNILQVKKYHFLIKAKFTNSSPRKVLEKQTENQVNALKSLNSFHETSESKKIKQK